MKGYFVFRSGLSVAAVYSYDPTIEGNQSCQLVSHTRGIMFQQPWFVRPESLLGDLLITEDAIPFYEFKYSMVRAVNPK